MDIRAQREYRLIEEGANLIDERGAGEPEILIVLGSGLSDSFISAMDIDLKVDMKEIPYISIPSAPSHKQSIYVGNLLNHRVAIMTGRLHLYEGYNALEVVRPIRMIGWLGAKLLIVTNAAGGLNENMTPGDVMVIEDHINLLGFNPLTGPNINTFGVRFPMLAHAYSPRYIRKIDEIARLNKMNLHFGVYAAVLGPSFETGAETRMLKTLGADAVGMSTVPEVIAASHMGMDVLGFSVITNVNDPSVMSYINEEDVIKNAKNGARKVEDLVFEFLKRITL